MSTKPIRSMQGISRRNINDRGWIEKDGNYPSRSTTAGCGLTDRPGTLRKRSEMEPIDGDIPPKPAKSGPMAFALCRGATPRSNRVRKGQVPASNLSLSEKDFDPLRHGGRTYTRWPQLEKSGLDSPRHSRLTDRATPISVLREHGPSGF